jgi:hypothetical protein
VYRGSLLVLRAGRLHAGARLEPAGGALLQRERALGARPDDPAGRPRSLLSRQRPRGWSGERSRHQQ